MPILTRLFIKTSFLYLIVALLIGVLLVGRSVWQLPAWLAGLSPVYFHLLMVGWVTQLIFGVAYWMLPKYSQQQPHGFDSVWWATFWLLNIGVLLRAIAEPLRATPSTALWGWLLATSAVLQWLAGIAFVFNAWLRTKER